MDKCATNDYQSNGHHANGVTDPPVDEVKTKVTDNTDQNLDDGEVPVCPPQIGYHMSVIKCLILYPLAILPLCLGLLFAYWFPSLWLRLTSSRTPLDKATYVIVKDADGKFRVEKVRTVKLPHSSCGKDKVATVINDGSHDSTVDEDTVLLVSEEKSFRYFTHRHLRYLYSPRVGQFVLLQGFDHGYPSSEIHDMVDGLSLLTHKDKLLHYGANSIDVPVTPYPILLVQEVLHPFYIFQVLSVIFWLVDTYYYYSGAVFLISTISLLVSLIQTRRNMQQLKDMVLSSSTHTVIREGRDVSGVPSEDLVPGDVLVIPSTGMVMQCDAALISGHAIVNEAMLTGESVPVTKTPLPSDPAHYHPDTHKRHTLFNGTQIIQTRFYGNSKVTAVVVRTGFSTSKGGMVRSILFPKPLNLKFYSDAMKFVLVMALIALSGFIYTIVILQLKHYQIKETILRAFDVITIVVPPALPSALTVGTVYALNRLRKQNIFCISPQRVNMCGKIKLVCFDKTGTLTEDSLDMFGVHPAHHGQFSPLIENPCTLTSGPLLHAMASCHSLTRINGQLSGDPLDLKMFQATKWVLEEPLGDDCTHFDTVVPTVVRPLTMPPSDEPVELGIMRQFTFSSELQRMAVLVRSLPSTSSQFTAYVKGAPETIKKLCRPETMPDDFFEVLGLLTQQGYRVLAVGHKSISMPWHKAERIKRDAVECGLTFAGLIVMQNRLKVETTPIIKTLRNASIRTVMITGDNILTAVSVARECRMVPAGSHVAMVKASSLNGRGRYTLSYHLLGESNDLLNLLESRDSHDFKATDETEIRSATPLLPYDAPPPLSEDQSCYLAVDGKTFAIIKEHFSDTIYQRLLVKGTVFARMSPTQKAQLVTSLMDIGYGVCMCGDGANDCRALKAAHAGVSLSETEASVASPFTSKIPNISCVPTLIKEGRAALVTSFSVFKFMALYSFNEFITASILYSFESNLGDQQYLYIDLILILALSFAMGFTGAYPRLVKKRPPGTLAGVHVLLSIAVQTIILLVFQLGALFYLQSQYWYVPFVPTPDGENIVSRENTVLFQMSIFQYVGLSIALSTAAPFRRALFTNILFMISLVVLVPANLYILLAPPHWVPGFWQFMQLLPFSDWLFRLGMLEMAFLCIALAYFIEAYILPTQWMRRFLRVVRCKRRPFNRYKHILSSIPSDWPPLNPAAGTIN